MASRFFGEDRILSRQPTWDLKMLLQMLPNSDFNLLAALPFKDDYLIIEMKC